MELFLGIKFTNDKHNISFIFVLVVFSIFDFHLIKESTTDIKKPAL